MKIAINTRFLLPGRLEGFGWYTHEIARRMVLAHPEDEFLFLFDRPFDKRFVYADNVMPQVLFPRARHAAAFYAWFEWRMPKALRDFGADVFFSPDAMCSLSATTPTAMTCHDLVPLHYPRQIPFRHRYYLLHYLPKFLRRADRIITVSEYVRQDIVRSCGVPSEKIVAVYNGCREGFSPLDDAEKRVVRKEFADRQEYFFYSGAIHPRKNIPRLIRAYDRFRQKTGAPVKLLLAGRFAWKTGAVKTALEHSPFRDDIRLLGYVTDEHLALLMASALALVYVSTSEGFGLPLLEAMYAETPVLSANATALPEVAGNAALLVDPYSEAEIAEGMERLWADRTCAAHLIDAGRRQRKRFSWDHAAEQTYQLLKETAGK
ncbi:MAG: glycosyltransferase family 1 protein [Saprospiraceae bacterium]